MSITVKHLTYSYDAGTPFQTDVLLDVDFSIRSGEFVGLMGHTGCGKSTLMRLMAGLLHPTSGAVLIDDEDICRRSYDREKLRRSVGVVFQFPESQLFEMSVEKDVSFALKHSGLSRTEIAERVRWALELVGMDYAAVRDLSPLGLSGGEKRRVAIAGVLAAKPAHLILDEPTVGLDPSGRESLLEMLRELNTAGMTILMISHHADSLGELADRLLVLDHGKLVKDGPTAEVFRDIAEMERLGLGVSQSREIAALLARSGRMVSQAIVSYQQLLDAVCASLAERGLP